MAFEIIEHTADLAVELTGKTMNELLESAVSAFVCLLTNPESVHAELKKTFTISAHTPEGLLVGVVNELIYLFEVEEFIPHHAVVATDGKTARCEVIGELIDTTRHTFDHYVKSATYGGLKVGFDENIYKATLILDD